MSTLCLTPNAFKMDYLTPKQAAKRLGIRRESLHLARRRGDIESAKRLPNGYYLYKPSEVERFAEKRRVRDLLKAKAHSEALIGPKFKGITPKHTEVVERLLKDDPKAQAKMLKNIDKYRLSVKATRRSIHAGRVITDKEIFQNFSSRRFRIRTYHAVRFDFDMWLKCCNTEKWKKEDRRDFLYFFKPIEDFIKQQRGILNEESDPLPIPSGSNALKIFDTF